VNQLSTQQVRSWHRSIVILFLFMGAAWAALLTRMPLVKSSLAVTSTQLGLILIAGGVGSLIGLNLIGRMIATRGTKVWITVFYPTAAALIILGGFAIEAGMPVAYAIVGFLLGCTFGLVDVPVNVDGTELEKLEGRNLMPRLHAGYSAGTLIGSGWGALAASLNLGILPTILPLAIVQVIVPFVLRKHLPDGVGIEVKVEHESDAKPQHWFSFVLVFLGLGILGITLAEGGAGDWMALGFKEGYGATEAQAGIGFSLFFAGMVLVRYFGGNIADRIGKGRALQLLAGIGVAGILLVILSSPNVVLGWIGAALWGAGVALGFPLFLSAAGEGENSARRVSFVASWGYAAFLAGPPLLGLLADTVGMLNMYYVMAALMVMALFAARAVRNK
jgi:MFS family permease